MRDIFDTHAHAVDLNTTSDAIVRAMDKNGVRRMCLIAPFKTLADREIAASLPTKEKMTATRYFYHKNARAANEWIARIAREQPERITPIAYVDSIAPDGPAELERAVNLGCRGLKCFNIGHYPWDERAFPLYEKAEALGLPVLFHSGAIGDARNSRFHRPAEYEILKLWPRLKVILAHLSWPWTDEAIAVAGMCAHNDPSRQMHLDLTPGAPLPWREDATRKALGYLPGHVLLFGTDNTESGPRAAQIVAEQDAIFDKLGTSQAVRRQIYWENAIEVYGQ